MSDYREALDSACATVGLDPVGARLLRLGSNAVYRLRAPVVARISRPSADIEHVRRTVAVARWLESVGYPAVRVVDVDQPVDVDGYVVTFWLAISDDGDEYASTPEIAEALRQLHHLTAPEALSIPPLQPFAEAARRVTSSKRLGAGDQSFLASRLAELEVHPLKPPPYAHRSTEDSVEPPVPIVMGGRRLAVVRACQPQVNSPVLTGC